MALAAGGFPRVGLGGVLTKQLWLQGGLPRGRAGRSSHKMALTCMSQNQID
jgi:hypothetical protein